METNSEFATPVLLLVFNRPEPTARVFERVRQARPARLFIAADGPRADRADDAELCRKTREAVSKIDWPCQVKTLFRENNRGCRHAVSEAISWFFENVSEGIILEDDCLPEPTFFPYCEALLARYRNEPRVMHVSGDNFQEGARRGHGSYYFSRWAHIWGWATWRRAWSQYDVSMRQLASFAKGGGMANIFLEKEIQEKWINVFQKVARGEIDTWDYQWVFAVWRNDGLAALPNVNLVSNIGFDSAATHTKSGSPLANLPTRPLPLEELKHPSAIEPDVEADLFTARRIFGVSAPQKSLWRRAASALKF